MPQITVYSTPFCMPCERLKKYLTERNITFTSKDLMMDEDAAERLDSLGIRSSPVLEIDGEFYMEDQISPNNLSQLLEFK